MITTCTECARRFDLTDPAAAQEWSFGHDCEIETETHKETETMDTKTCGCGCGTPVASKRNFKPGHDARRKGQLLVELRSGDPARIETARAAAETLGWGWLIEQATSKQPRRSTKTDSAAPTPEPTVQFSKVKIGRWLYDITHIEPAPEVGSYRVAYCRKGAKFDTHITVRETALS